ncbi:MAG: preprotein translocase subunit SecF [Frankiales bacterium]|nr:preprotein translocase subunit SecF [Frankiales bacterium]
MSTGTDELPVARSGDAKRRNVIHRLYHGETTFPLIQARKKFYAVSLILVLVGLGSMIFRGFNLGVEFKGGSIFTVSAPSNVDIKATRDFVDTLGTADAIVQTVRTSKGDTKIRIETPPLSEDARNKIGDAVAKRFNVDPNTQLDIQSVGASWGKEVTKKALQGLVAFLIAVIAYISIRFEPKMAAAAIIALLHDLILAAGVYSVTYFVITPSTIIALLTVLGYSLYDTIVVFDKVAENTKGIERRGTTTYSEASELAVNQTFMRSINTSLIALLPVSGLLFVGALLLGAGTLKDLSLALFVGLASGAYSSLFLATPLLADLKEREPRFIALTQRVADRRTKGAAAPLRLSDKSVYAPAGAAGGVAVAEEGASAAAVPGAARRPAKKQPKRKKGTRPSGKRKR